VVESPFAAVRLRTSAAKRFKKVANATALIWRLLMVAKRRFRKLNAPELLAAVARGEPCVRWSVRVVPAEGRRLIRIYTPIDGTSGSQQIGD
jgi:hypothetical protein